jgi:predicted transcriptional regulator
MAETRHDLETVLKAVESGITITGAARLLGCSRQTVHAYRKRWKAVDDAITGKRHELVDLAENGLRKAVEKDEPWAIAFTLKTLGKDQGFSERTEVTGPDGRPLSIAYVNDWRKQN